MSVTATRSESATHLVLRLSAGEVLPEALVAKLAEERVQCGWLRASGVLADVELRAFDPVLGTLGSVRRLSGHLHAISLEGSIGLSGGEPVLSLRAIIARDGDRGLRTFAGEIASARVVAVEAFVIALEDVALERSLDPVAGVWLLGSATARTGAASHAAKPPAAPAPPAAWSSALEASEHLEARHRYSPGGSPAVTVSAPIPQRPARPPTDLDAPTPESGDAVDHFAFGPADVVKSDGDRLHLKVHKDSRIREIALEMLRVSRLPDGEDGRRRFKLERKM